MASTATVPNEEEEVVVVISITPYVSNRSASPRLGGLPVLITEGDLAEDLKKKLFPGIKNESVMDRLESVQTFKAVTLCITTRAIGFSAVNIFTSLYEFNNVPVQGEITQFYRVGLAIIQTKVALAQRGVTAIMDNEDDYAELSVQEDLVSLVKSVVALPDQFTSVINAIGKVKTNDRLYVPKIGKHNETRGRRFIPQSEQVTYQNLRMTVQSLADEHTAVEYRRRFYRNNPIPVTIWRNGPDEPILTNPDEIMPADYTIGYLTDDINDLRGKMNFLNKKAPKYFTKAVSFSPDGDKSMLVCNSQENLRVIDRNANEDWPHYYGRLKLVGDISEYYNLKK